MLDVSDLLTAHKRGLHDIPQPSPRLWLPDRGIPQAGVILRKIMNLGASYTASRLVVVCTVLERLGACGSADRNDQAAGAFAFVTCVVGWWIFLSILLASVDFPLTLPIGDLSTMIKGASGRGNVGADGAV